jgi:uncharacterized membrane protein
VKILRGAEPTRLDALVDAAFAFAITLLVLWNDRLPNDFDSLVAIFGLIPSFAASFALIAFFWWRQVRWSRNHRVEDNLSTVLSLALVFVVLIFVFPLRIMSSTFLSWITAGFLPTPFEGDVDGRVLCVLFLTYGLAFASMSACVFGLYRHSRSVRMRDPSPEDAGVADAAVGASVALTFTVVGLLSATLAAVFLLAGVTNVWVLAIAGWVYFLLLFTGMVGSRVRRRSADRESAAAGR